MSNSNSNSKKLEQIADQIENQPQAREAIALGFRIIAAILTDEEDRACTDCTSQQGQALDPAGNPEAGADTAPAGVDLVDTATGPGLDG